MKKVRVTTTILAMAFMSLTAMSCKDGKTDDAAMPMSNEMYVESTTENADEMAMNTNQSSNAKQVIADYMILKEALIATDKDAAAKAGNQMVITLKGFEYGTYTAEEQKELKDIITDAVEHAEHIGKSEMDHQREHFKTLSKDMLDMVAITGADGKMYKMSCPMYDGGSAWLSMEKEVKNPYYGSKMMSCGKMEKEIN